ncbi:MAG: hypothetical protein JO286_24150 [Solirubrobacterales bacterium]|nr:hypothetical protein [Solirubrobacterales bacterium]
MSAIGVSLAKRRAQTARSDDPELHPPSLVLVRPMGDSLNVTDTDSNTDRVSLYTAWV